LKRFESAILIHISIFSPSSAHVMSS